MNHQTHRETIPELRAAAWVAMITMAVICVGGFKLAFFTEPRTITNREVIMMPNDSVLAMNHQISALKYEAMEWRAIADTRGNVINSLTVPMKWITDSLRSLQLSMIDIGNRNHALLTAQEVSRERMFAALMVQIAENGCDVPDIRALMDEQTLVLSGLMGRDTIYQVNPADRLNFWRGLDAAFSRKR